jgi:flagellar biosynthesis protein FliR
MSPIFSRTDIPALIKVGLSAVFSFVLYDFIFPLSNTFIPTQAVSLGLGIFHELLIGMMLGLLCNLIFDAIATLTHLVGIQSGMSSSNIFDPTTGSTINAMGVFYITVALIFFLSFDGLYHLIFIIRKSFEIIPLASFSIDFGALAANYIEIFNTIFLIAMKFTLPILALMFVVDVFVALFAKILPQANIFFLVMPNKIFFAVFIITAILGGFYLKFQDYFDSQIYELFDQLFS